MALVDSRVDLQIADVGAEPGGRIIDTGVYGFRYYNALLGIYDILPPVDMPVGSIVGISAYGINSEPFAQKMSIYVYIYDPNGDQIAAGFNMIWAPPVWPGGRIYSGEVEGIAEIPGLYTAAIELYAVID